ncbi:hypothetical protein ACIQF6_19605 [Kitasatospora sp. NPDC092948]|uniref:hypothetical protein n=1 Tax=Kitasatospora sp. NPDC092948 TaxID=3364088 RepID=UPI003822A46D
MMTRAEMFRLSGYWFSLTRLGMDHPDDVHAMFDAFHDMRRDLEFARGLGILLDEAFDAPDTF